MNWYMNMIVMNLIYIFLNRFTNRKMNEVYLIQKMMNVNFLFLFFNDHVNLMMNKIVNAKEIEIKICMIEMSYHTLCIYCLMKMMITENKKIMRNKNIKLIMMNMMMNKTIMIKIFSRIDFQKRKLLSWMSLTKGKMEKICVNENEYY